MALGDIRTAIATNLATISGLRTRDRIEGSVTPPVAVVGWPEEIDYDSSMGRGVDELFIPVLVIVGTASERAADSAIEGYLAKSGSGSVKAAIESDKTLGGAAKDIRVTRMRGIKDVSFGGEGGPSYLAAEFLVHVIE